MSDEPKKRQRCADCLRYSDPVVTNYTLIGSRQGWRSIIMPDENGQRDIKWFCPTCWNKRKSAGSVKP